MLACIGLKDGVDRLVHGGAIDGGVPLGAMIEYQPTDSKPGKPASCRVGTSGSFSSRVVLVTASGRRFPSNAGPSVSVT